MRQLIAILFLSAAAFAWPLSTPVAQPGQTYAGEYDGNEALYTDLDGDGDIDFINVDDDGDGNPLNDGVYWYSEVRGAYVKGTDTITPNGESVDPAGSNFTSAEGKAGSFSSNP